MSAEANAAGISEPDGVRSADVVVGMQAEQVPVTRYVDAYYWRCSACGWLGTGCATLDSAMSEARRHLRKDHDRTDDALVYRKDARHG